MSIKDIQVASRGGKIKMGSRENSAKKVCARNTKMQKPFYDYLNLDACQSAADALLVCSILACIGWAIYAFSIAKTFDLWVIVVAGALPVFAAVSIYVLLASIVAVFEIAKNLRQLCTEVSQLRQEK